MNQDQIFTSGEGDEWYKRNQTHLMTIDQAKESEDVRYLCETLQPFHFNIHRVLEVGCSNGIKLETICQQMNAVGIGIEPSRLAVETGNLRDKVAKIDLIQGSGDKLPCKSADFDLVFFAFCLYLFDRASLMQAFAEADRVLKPGGFLVVTDFDPGFNHRRPYSHCPGVFSYKQDYSVFFTQSGLYHLLGKHSYSHRYPHFDKDRGERVSTSILYKEANPYSTYQG